MRNNRRKKTNCGHQDIPFSTTAVVPSQTEQYHANRQSIVAYYTRQSALLLFAGTKSQTPTNHSYILVDIDRYLLGSIFAHRATTAEHTQQSTRISILISIRNSFRYKIRVAQDSRLGPRFPHRQDILRIIHSRFFTTPIIIPVGVSYHTEARIACMHAVKHTFLVGNLSPTGGARLHATETIIPEHTAPHTPRRRLALMLTTRSQPLAVVIHNRRIHIIQRAPGRKKMRLVFSRYIRKITEEKWYSGLGSILNPR